MTFSPQQAEYYGIPLIRMAQLAMRINGPVKDATAADCQYAAFFSWTLLTRFQLCGDWPYRGSRERANMRNSCQLAVANEVCDEAETKRRLVRSRDEQVMAWLMEGWAGGWPAAEGSADGHCPRSRAQFRNWVRAFPDKAAELALVCGVKAFR